MVWRIKMTQQQWNAEERRRYKEREALLEEAARRLVYEGKILAGTREEYLKLKALFPIHEGGVG